MMSETTATDPAPKARPQTAETGAALIYDGECPFCSAYTRFVRLRDAVGPVQLVDAREGGPLVDEVLGAGFDLDEGMVLKLGGRYYHGSDCIHMLGALSSGSSPFNRLNGWIFASPARARRLYPVLRAGRNTVLRLLGRRKFSARAARPAAFPD